MKKQIIIGAILVIIGVLLGFFVVVNWQLRQSIKNVLAASNQDANELTKIEKYLSPPSADNNQNK